MSMGSSDMAYWKISSSVRGYTSTSVLSKKTLERSFPSSPLRITQTPVYTWWTRPDSIPIISRASSWVFGFPRIFPSMATTVSEPITVSPAFLPAATSAAFWDASSMTTSDGTLEVTCSTTWLTTISGWIPICKSSSFLLGDADARTTFFISIFCFLSKKRGRQLLKSLQPPLSLYGSSRSRMPEKHF